MWQDVNKFKRHESFSKTPYTKCCLNFESPDAKNWVRLMCRVQPFHDSVLITDRSTGADSPSWRQTGCCWCWLSAASPASGCLPSGSTATPCPGRQKAHGAFQDTINLNITKTFILTRLYIFLYRISEQCESCLNVSHSRSPPKKQNKLWFQEIRLLVTIAK